MHEMNHFLKKSMDKQTIDFMNTTEEKRSITKKNNS
jgi:hypothetical protein